MTIACTHEPPHPAVAQRQCLGALGESLAAEYLEHHGYDILDRNWRTAHGELDLVARHQHTIVAVEVKTRSGTGYGSPLEAITPLKLRRVRALLLSWARRHGVRATALRVDAIAVRLNGTAAPTIEHLQGVS